jgi:hypothetical protein
MPLCSGRYAVIIVSKTLFKGSQGWQSHKEILDFVVPETPSDITTYLKTEVSRKKRV